MARMVAEMLDSAVGRGAVGKSDSDPSSCQRLPTFVAGLALPDQKR